MSQSISASTKKRGRPKTTGKGEQVGVRLQSDLLSALDKLIAEHPAEDRPSRPDIIRTILREWLKANGFLPK